MYCWIGVGPACPTRPPHQRGTELLTNSRTFGCVNRRAFSQSAISGTMACAMASASDALLRPSAARGNLNETDQRPIFMFLKNFFLSISNSINWREHQKIQNRGWIRENTFGGVYELLPLAFAIEVLAKSIKKHPRIFMKSALIWIEEPFWFWRFLIGHCDRIDIPASDM